MCYRVLSWVRRALDAYFLLCVSLVRLLQYQEEHTSAVSSVEQHEMLQHLIFEDEELLAIGLLDDIARGGVFGDLGLGGQPDAGDRASRDAHRSRALGGSGSSGGGVCLLVGGHGDFVCFCLVSQAVIGASRFLAQLKIARDMKHYKRENAQQIDLQEMWLWLIMEESLFGARTLCLPCEAAGPSVTHMLNILPLSLLAIAPPACFPCFGAMALRRPSLRGGM